MEIRIITPVNGEQFENLILPKIYRALMKGVPVIALGLFEQGTAIGALAGFFQKGDIFEVRSFYVAPEFRRMGGGTMLIKALVKLLEGDRIPAVLSVTEGTEESDTLIEFMKSVDAYEDNSLERIYRGTVGAFYDTGLFVEDYKNRSIKSLEHADKWESGEVKRLFGQLDTGRYGDPAAISRELSFLAAKDDEIRAFVVVKQPLDPSGNLDQNGEPVLVFSRKPDVKILAGLMNRCLNECRDVIGEDRYIRIPATDSRLDRMMDSLEGVVNIQHNYLF